MPPVDLETLIRGGGGCVGGGGGGGDGKVVCETLIDSQLAEVAPPPPDFPAESFRLPKEEELEWFDRNAFYDRKPSTRGNAAGFGPNGAIHPSAPSNSSSQRISVKSKAHIFGLPKLPDSGQLRRTLRRSVRRPSIRFFPRQQSGKPALTEPSSPKVSCIGRVRSKRDKRRRRGERRDGGGSGRGEIKSAKSAAAAVEEEIKKPSIWRSLRSMLRLSGGRRRRRDRRSEASERRSPETTDSSTDLGREKSASAPVTIPAAGDAPPSLGDLRRFSSGRRSASWGAIGFEVEAETDAGGSRGREPSKTTEVWRRRAAAQPPEAIRCDRDLDSVGPATV